MSSKEKGTVIFAFCFLTLSILVSSTVTNIRITRNVETKVDKKYVDSQDSVMLESIKIDNQITRDSISVGNQILRTISK